MFRRTFIAFSLQRKTTIVHSCLSVVSCNNEVVSFVRQNRIWIITERDTNESSHSELLSNLRDGYYSPPSNQTECHMKKIHHVKNPFFAVGFSQDGRDGSVMNYMKFIIFTLKWFSMNKFSSGKL